MTRAARCTWPLKTATTRSDVLQGLAYSAIASGVSKWIGSGPTGTSNGG